MLLLAVVAIGSAIAVICFKNPLKSALAAALNIVVLTLLFVWLSAPMLGLVQGTIGLLLLAGLFQFVRSLDPKRAVTPHRFGFGQLIGLLGGFLFAVFILLHLSGFDGAEGDRQWILLLELRDPHLVMGAIVCGLLLLSAMLGFRSLLRPTDPGIQS